MASAFNGNNYFTGVQPSTTPFAPQVLSANALTALTVQTSNLSATNVPIVGTTIVATLPASWYKSPYFNTVTRSAANPIQLVDLNGTPIQLPLNIAATATTAPVDFYLTECLFSLNAFGPANTTWAAATAQTITLGTTNAAGTANIVSSINYGTLPDGTGGGTFAPIGATEFASNAAGVIATLTLAQGFNNQVGGTYAGGGTGLTGPGGTGTGSALNGSVPGWSALSYVVNPATASTLNYFGIWFTAISTGPPLVNAAGNYAVGQLFIYLSYLQVNPQPTGQFFYTNPTTFYPGIK